MNKKDTRELCSLALNVLSDEDLAIRAEEELKGKMDPQDYEQVFDMVAAIRDAAELANEVLKRWEFPEVWGKEKK